MYMPLLPTASGIRSVQTEAFYGLERRDNAKDGTLRDGTGLSPLDYPALSSVSARVRQSAYTAPTDLYGWDELVTVEANGLYYGGRFLCNVTPGRKQFAVVSGRLIVWPDKLAVNLRDASVVRLDAQTASLQGSEVTVTTDKITLALSPLLGTAETGHMSSGNASTGYYSNPGIRLYTGATAANGVWSWTGAEEVSQGTVFDNKSNLTAWLNGRVVLPSKTEAGAYHFDANFLVNSSRTWPAPNTDGVYGVISEVHTHSVDGSYPDDAGFGIGDIIWCVCKLYRYGANNAKFTDFFSAGDVVTVSGMATAANNIVKKQIVSLTDTSLTFAANTFTAGTQTASVTVQRAIPALDYICAGDNRLWGVCNADRTAYASALGDPTAFYDFAGTSADSYALAFETKGDFTGVCFYSGDMLLWKEDLMHRIYGDYPAAYYMTTYSIRGVMAGADRSLHIINEVLYYLSRDGVMAYAGGTPSLVSYALGDAARTFGGAGADGRLYHLTVCEGGTWRHLVYDPQTSIWLCERQEQATAFALSGGSFYVLAADAVYLCAQSGDTDWSAELNPFDEQTVRRKDYKRLYLRCEGSGTLLAEISADGALWHSVYAGAAPSSGTLLIPLSPMRCDRLRLRLSGTGRMRLLTLRRDFIPDSEQ